MSEEKTIESQVNQIVTEIKTKLNDKSFTFKDQRELIQKIASFKSWQIIEPLESLLGYEKTNTNMKVKILEVLGELGDPRVIKILTSYANNADKNIKNAAIKGLSLIENIKCVPPLLEAINSEDKWIKIFAIRGLQKNYSKKLLKPILDKLGDGDDYVRQEAMSALKKVVGEDDEDDLIQALNTNNRFMKLGVIALLGEKEVGNATKKLIECLDDPDKRISLVASRSLSKIADPNTIPELIVRALKSNDGPTGIFATSILNMGMAAVEPLVKLYAIATDDKLRNLIFNILKKFGNDIIQDIQEVIDQTEDKDQKAQMELLYKQF